MLTVIAIVITTVATVQTILITLDRTRSKLGSSELLQWTRIRTIIHAFLITVPIYIIIIIILIIIIIVKKQESVTVKL